MSRRARSLLLAGLLAGACADRRAPEGAPAGGAITAASLEAVPDDRALFGGGRLPEVSLAKTHFLWVRLEVQGELPSPVAWVTLRMYTPAGALHLERHVPFSTGAATGPVESRHGVGHPIEVVPAVATGRGWGLDMPILVAGSNLERRPLPGAWTVTASLDDRPEVATRAVVRLVQP